MDNERPLPNRLDVSAGGIAIVLFSQADCQFCAEIREHYLRPMQAERRPQVAIAESRIDDDAPFRDVSGRDVGQRAFSTAQGVRFAPTVMFFDRAGKSLATPIVGLSRDFFGVYLEQRIAQAMSAVRAAAARG